MKWEPILAMVALLALAMWLVWQPKETVLGLDLREGARAVEVRIGQTRGVLEIVEDEDGRTMRMIPRRGEPSEVLDEADFRRAYGEAIYRQTVLSRDPVVFRMLNITSWTGVIWVGIGFAGQVAFFGRMLIQWVVSERKRQSVVPAVFWWLSLFGGATLFTYFVWRQDIVGVLGQTTGVVIYARNLRLIHKQSRRSRRAAERAEAEALSESGGAGETDFEAKEPADEPSAGARR